ncbi:MAG: RDD family protein [Proteobacteria bacterium]|nr:RDD family protein [Pseudomonadota bacterium]
MSDIQTESPSLLRRLAAISYDTFLVLPLIMVSVAVGLGLRTAAGLEPHNNTQLTILDASLVQLIALTSVIAFFSYFWLKNGQTLSMQAWRIKLVSSSGGAVRFHQAILRCLAAVVSAACLGAGYWWCLFDARGRSWHDHLSGTELVLLPKVEKKKKP